MCWFLPRGEARDGWRGQAIGLAQAVCLCVSWCCVCAGGMRSTLLLLRAPCFWHQLFRDDSWDFGLFVSCRPQFPPTGIHAVIFLSPIVSLYFVAGEDVWISRTQQ